ncbi:MAG: hypothetical protein IJ214_00035 [Clostridia bacterium]|nr:hypothetical protein [Clostridia bacterium]
MGLTISQSAQRTLNIILMKRKCMRYENKACPCCDEASGTTKKRVQAEKRLRAGNLWNEGDFPGLVFTNEYGKHYGKNTMLHNMQKLAEKVGVRGDPLSRSSSHFRGFVHPGGG